MKTDLKTVSGTVASLAIIFTGFVTIETRYAKASDVDQLLRGQEQKTIWDLEENVEKGDSRAEQQKWLRRLREKVAEFCAKWPDEDECHRDYLEHVEEFLLEN
jgi:hypothetical protein